MRIGLDTSVVLRLITGEPKVLALVALREVQRCLARKDVLMISDLVISEIYFALQHHYRANKSAALKILGDFLRMSAMETSAAAKEVLTMPSLATLRPGFVDRLIHAEYLNSGAGMVTFEKSAARLSGVRVLTG
ncbi:MAG: PIN domain-containing protein [Gammaproteobacteria bacterium]|nr:PIN domain-containing protein [Gammaproteobacteria bacterium]